MLWKPRSQRNAIFRVDKQLEEGHALLRGKAVELTLLVIGPARHIAREKGVVNGIADRAALRQHQNVFWSAPAIVDLIADERGDAGSLVSQCWVLENLNLAGTIAGEG